MNKEKRVRSSNFNKEEELLLVQEIGKFKDIIECKTTNKISSSEKEEAWQKIMKNFNVKNFEIRSLSQIKSKYDNLKTKARKEFAKYKCYLRGTGGGPSIKDELDPVLQAILDIINLKTVGGLFSPYDADSNVNNMMSEDVIMEVVPPKINNYDQDFLNATVISESEDLVLTNKCEVEPPSATVTEFADISISHYEVELQNHVSVATSLDHNYVTPHDIASTSSCSTPLTNKTNGRQQIKRKNLSPQVKQQESGWSKYVPSKLKKQTSSRLRPTVPNPIFCAKEQYYKRKLELLEQSVDRENMEREKRMKREEEEHQAKMIIYNLDIELKKLELENKKNM